MYSYDAGKGSRNAPYSAFFNILKKVNRIVNAKRKGTSGFQ